MSADHLDNIQITISLDPAPVVGANFGAVLFEADESTGTTLGGDRVRSYTSLAGVQTDNTAGEVGAVALAAAVAAFSQSPAPSLYKIGRKAPGDSYVDALALIEAVDPDFYGLALESRTPADIVLVSPIVEASAVKRLLFFQSGDADWKTSGGIPAAFSAIDNSERTVCCFHDDATEFFDTAYPANRLAFDADLKSVPWALFDLKGVAALTSPPSDTEKLNLDINKANHGLPFGGIAIAPDPGVNLNNRPIYEMLTRDWFEARLRERIAAVVGAAGTAGRKIPVTLVGQGIILAEVLAQFQQGVTAGHFVQGETDASGVAITDADRAAQRLRIKGRAQFVVSARKFDFDFEFTRNPITVGA